MVVFTAGTWSSGQSAARPEIQYHHVQLLYISVEFIHVYCTVCRIQVTVLSATRVT